MAHLTKLRHLFNHRLFVQFLCVATDMLDFGIKLHTIGIASMMLGGNYMD